MENRRILRMIFEIITFFILFYIVGYFFIEYRILKIALFLLLILLFSYRNILYINFFRYKKYKFAILFIFFLTFIFEISKAIGYSIGLLPKYTDVHFIFSILASLFSITIYYLILLLVSNFIKKLIAK